MPKAGVPKAKKKLGGVRPPDGGPRSEKAATVADVAARLGTSEAVLLTEYRGMKVHELAELRASLGKLDTDYKIIKNTLATIAVKQVGLDDLVAMLQGPTALAFVRGDVVKAAKEISDFAKKAPTLTLKGALFAGKVLSEKDARGLATVDSRDVSLAKMVGLFASPLQRTAGLFAAPLQQMGALFAQLKDKLPAEPAA